jgi:hypothetical protein
MRVVSPSNLAADFSSALPRRRNSSPSSSAAELTWPPAVELARPQARGGARPASHGGARLLVEVRRSSPGWPWRSSPASRGATELAAGHSRWSSSSRPQRSSPAACDAGLRGGWCPSGPDTPRRGRAGDRGRSGAADRSEGERGDATGGARDAARGDAALRESSAGGPRLIPVSFCFFIWVRHLPNRWGPAS